jgi:hypothetical protein
MRSQLLMAAALGLAALAHSSPTYADPAATGHAPGDAHGIEPGSVGPGSENSSRVSPTSPSVPANKQPPAGINVPSNAGTGVSSGEKGSGPEGTAPPHNPSAPGLQ